MLEDKYDECRPVNCQKPCGCSGNTKKGMHDGYVCLNSRDEFQKCNE